MSRLYLISFVLIVCLSCANGRFNFDATSSISFGNCPRVTTKPDFDTRRYVGNWYQAQGNPQFFYEPGVSCIRATYRDRGDGSVSVHNVATKREGGFSEICGYAKVRNPAVPGVLDVFLGGSFVPIAGDYRVLDTDYDNYAAVYGCRSLFGLLKFESGFLLTRSLTPSTEVVNQALSVFERNGLRGLLSKFITFYTGPDCRFNVPNSCANRN